jgi:hypothetical protein
MSSVRSDNIKARGASSKTWFLRTIRNTATGLALSQSAAIRLSQYDMPYPNI